MKTFKATTMSRRTMLTTFSSTSAMLTLPVLGRADVEDPILPLYRQWVSARAEWYRYADLPGNGDWDMPESQAAQAQEDAAFWAMIEMTPTSMAGIAALAQVLWDLEGPTVTLGQEGYREQASTPSCKLMSAIWRAASGHKGLPLDSKMETGQRW